MKTYFLYFSFALLLSCLVYINIPDYTRRGEVVVVSGQTIGFILEQNKLGKKKIRVLYSTSTGEWLEHDFPEETVKPITVLKAP